MNKIKFNNCNCEIIPGKFDIKNIPLTCEATFNLISSGFTTGIFQLESRLGSDWSKKVKPQNIKELAALTAILRPSALESGMSDLYVDIKFGKKKPSYIHPALEDIFKDTNSAMLFQEQILRVATELAGFSLEDGDLLRIAMGKKKADLMAKLKIKFIDGCTKKKNINKNIAEEIFGWIEKSQRYSFNMCLSGDTIIQKQNNQHGRKFTIKEMYEIMNFNTLNGKKLKTSIRANWIKNGHYGTGLSLCEDGLIRFNVIKDIRPSGKQQLYNIFLENGSTIRATLNHKFPTDKGDIELKDLDIGDELYIINRKKWCQYRSVEENRKRTKLYQTIDMKNFKKFAYKCCWRCGSTQKLEINHKDKNFLNNKWENLELLCVPCHKNFHKNDKKLKPGQKGWGILSIKIKEIKKDKIEETWDVTMNAPNHNFVTGNNIVTCNSHAIAYSMLSYSTAYVKTHFPLEFFTSYLTYSNYKADTMDEIYHLVQDARLFGIEVLQPDIRDCNVKFNIVDAKIRFGLSSIKGVGESAIAKIIKNGPESMSTWQKFLTNVSVIHKDVGIALIKSGACDFYNMQRSQMVKELEIIFGTKDVKGLTERERKWFFYKLTNEKSVKDVLVEMTSKKNEMSTKSMSGLSKPEILEFAKEFTGLTNEDFTGKTKFDIINILKKYGFETDKENKPCSNLKRMETIKEKLNELEEELIDTNLGKATAEKYFLGIAISSSPADDADNSDASHTCLELAKAINGQSFSVCCVIDSVKHTKTKKGKNPGAIMCFLTISDSTYSIDRAVVFPDDYEKIGKYCKDTLICMIYGEKKNGSIIIHDIKKLI